MAEATQFALDAYHAPGPVLPRQAHDQGGQLLAGRRAARRLRLPYRAAISLRCQRNNVPGVTIRWARSALSLAAGACSGRTGTRCGSSSRARLAMPRPQAARSIQ